VVQAQFMFFYDYGFDKESLFENTTYVYMQVTQRLERFVQSSLCSETYWTTQYTLKVNYEKLSK